MHPRFEEVDIEDLCAELNSKVKIVRNPTRLLFSFPDTLLCFLLGLCLGLVDLFGPFSFSIMITEFISYFLLLTTSLIHFRLRRTMAELTLVC